MPDRPIVPILQSAAVDGAQYGVNDVAVGRDLAMGRPDVAAADACDYLKYGGAALGAVWRLQSGLAVMIAEGID